MKNRYLCSAVPNKINNHINSGGSAKVLAKPVNTSPKDTSVTPSLFSGHLLTVKNDKPQLHFTNYEYLVSGILLFLYVLFVWIYVSNYKKLSQVIKGFYISRFSNQLSREDLSIGNRVSVFLSIFFISTLTLFVSRVLTYYGFHPSIFGRTDAAVLDIFTALFITVAYCVKFASIKILGSLFKVQREANEYMMTIFLFCNVLGLFMLPLVICLTFVKQVPPAVFIYAGLGIIGIFVCVRFFRGLILGLNSSEISKLYLFMYLCTLEILPIIIIVKLFTLYVK